MIPKITFNWSSIYQESIHLPGGTSYDREESERTVRAFVEKVSDLWRPVERRVLEHMATLTNLSWKKDEIVCYIVRLSTFGPLSDPLTIPIERRTKSGSSELTVARFLYVLVHELVHNLLNQNERDLVRYWRGLHQKYPKENPTTVVHVPVHAILKEVYGTCFGSDALEEAIEIDLLYPSYRAAWALVEKETSAAVLQDFRHAA